MLKILLNTTKKIHISMNSVVGDFVYSDNQCIDSIQKLLFIKSAMIDF